MGDMVLYPMKRTRREWACSFRPRSGSGTRLDYSEMEDFVYSTMHFPVGYSNCGFADGTSKPVPYGD